MNYSEDPSSVRVDFFKDSGKYYTTEAIDWLHYAKETLIHDAFRIALLRHLTESDDNGRRVRLGGMWAVCLDPYHEQAYPLMMRVPEMPE